MSNFREMFRKGFRKKIKLLKSEHIILVYHFKARDFFTVTQGKKTRRETQVDDETSISKQV